MNRKYLYAIHEQIMFTKILEIMFTKIIDSTKLNAKQNSIKVALIPHVRICKHIIPN
jgi:hypothetical protein